MMKTYWNLGLVILALACVATGVGCGEDKKVRVGEEGETGVYKGSMNRASDVAGKATEQTKDNESALTGG